MTTTWLLLRGLSRDQRHWGRFPAQLADATGTATVTIDPPGFGDHHTGTSPATVAAITDDIATRFEPPDGPVGVLGISLGGMVALDWCARHPEMFDRCVVVNSSARPSRPWRRFRPGAGPVLASGRFRSQVGAERATLRATLNDPRHDLDDLAEQFAVFAKQRPASTVSIRNQLLAAWRFTLPTGLTTPTLVVTAAGDRLVHPDCSRDLARWLDAPLAVHPTGGHDLGLDAPEWLARTVADWNVSPTRS